jgi:hypothetical protein
LAQAKSPPAIRKFILATGLKATKGGQVCSLFLSGKDKAEVAKQLKLAFGLGDVQAVKTIRRITGRAKFFRRVFERDGVKRLERIFKFSNFVEALIITTNVEGFDIGGFMNG